MRRAEMEQINASIAHTVAAFHRNGMPGMSLKLAPRPLLNRCKCGRVISANKLACKACHDAEEHELRIAALVEILTTPEMFEAAMATLSPEMQERARAELLPRLKFTVSEESHG